MSAENTKLLLIAQMKRVIELLEQEESISIYSSTLAEIEKKLHEIRRDSIRYVKELKPWKK